MIVSVNIDKGELSIYYGDFRSNGLVDYIVQGVYFWKNGTVYLVMVPDNDFPVVQDYKLNLEGIDHIDLSRIEDLESYRTLVKHNITDAKNECYFKVWIAFESDVPQDVRLIDNGDFTIDRPFIQFKFDISSPNCDAVLSGDSETRLIEIYYRKMSNYVILAVVASAIQLFLFFRQLQKSRSSSALRKLSVTFIMLQAILDGQMCILHISSGVLIEKLFRGAILVGFLKFAHFSMFDLNLVTKIWRNNVPNNVTGFSQKMYFSAFVLFLIFLSGYFSIIIIIGYSFWIFQIVHQIKNSYRNAVDHTYVIGSSICRLAIPLYFLGCPENFIRLEPENWLVVFLIIEVIGSAIFLVLLDTYGLNFLQFIKDEPYDYFKPIPLAEQDRYCAICMTDVEENHAITPCNHIYHAECLSEWLLRKSTCPSCRTEIPDMVNKNL
eukprot:TRINITY_DN5483_c0_g1_i2.p1 TRINITY_DN5483_c0_g1~~TRINITY_DN5483_c0_g1_i2.p1  ORF type:complete len:437 (-),score=53.92 TRINITY_DN5483_c0_g1_i2:805-2115(-)